MMELFQRPEFLRAIFFVPLAVVASWIVSRRRARSLALYAGTMTPGRIAPGYFPAGRLIRAAILVAGGIFLVLTLARPQWGESSEAIVRKGIDIAIALDTSRSMACEDVSPNRFERARLAALDLLEHRAGDRVALIPFSETAGVACPLTLDYGAVRLFLDAAEVAADPVPGTNLARAIRQAAGAFEQNEKKYKVLILITDGEDHEGEAAAAAAEAAKDGVQIYALGVGELSGGPIPDRDENGNLAGYHRDRDGKVVTTRLNMDLLQKVASAGGGEAYHLAATANEVSMLGSAIDGIEKKDQKGTLAVRRQERYQWPLAIALLLIAAETVVPRIRKPRLRPEGGLI